MEPEGVQRGGESRGDRRRLCQEVLPDLHRPDRRPHDGGGSGSSAQDRADHDGQEASYHCPFPVQSKEGSCVDENLMAANYKLARDAYNDSYTLAAWSSQGKVFAKLKSDKSVRINLIWGRH